MKSCIKTKPGGVLAVLATRDHEFGCQLVLEELVISKNLRTWLFLSLKHSYLFQFKD